MTIAIIDCGSGNLRSVSKAFEHIGAECVVTNNIKQVENASRIVLPGVGAFGDVKAGLVAIDGMVATLTEQVIQNKKPFFGICVGMQLLADVGLEYGEHSGFGWIKGKVEAISPTNKNLKIPHMGWNSLDWSSLDCNSLNLNNLDCNSLTIKQHHIFNGVEQGADVYFVHSYHMICEDEANIIATVDYGQKITAAVAKDNIVAVQFHPEKSQKVGLRILENFLKI